MLSDACQILHNYYIFGGLNTRHVRSSKSSKTFRGSDKGATTFLDSPSNIVDNRREHKIDIFLIFDTMQGSWNAGIEQIYQLQNGLDDWLVNLVMFICGRIAGVAFEDLFWKEKAYLKLFVVLNSLIMQTMYV